MKIRYHIFIFFFFLFLINGCASILPGNKSTNNKKASYTEDLSRYRATLAPEIQKIEDHKVTEIHIPDSTTAPVNEKINYLMDTVTAYTKTNINYIEGFTIQVYAGSDRELANEFKLDILRHFPECEPKMVFEQPNYKVRIGLFYTRLEAQYQFNQVKDVFAKAILIPTRIEFDD
jgi:hypothetical protein